ncbi:MAG: hypothetical protein ACRDNW_11865 [Trebonia sp.]
MSKRTVGGTARRHSPGPRSGTRFSDPDDELLAAVLIRMWTLASGRTLRRDVPPDQLSTEELIAFWADDMTPPAGRHARAGDPNSAPGTWDPGRPDGKTPHPRRRTRRNHHHRDADGRRELPADPAAA